MIEPESKEPLGLTDTLRALKPHDEELFGLVLHSFNRDTWKQMMGQFKEHRPREFRDWTNAIMGLKGLGDEGSLPSDKDIALEAANSIAQEALKTYTCKGGFGDESEQTHPVTIRLKYDRTITGLPKEIMAQSSRLARDHGGRRKWTMGFDNRIFVADLSQDAIEKLRQSDQVAAVEVEPMAKIMSTEMPTYSPSAVNTDWGVARVLPTNAWNKGLKGEGVKLCIIDTGIRADHVAFWDQGVTNFKGGYNFVAGNSNPADDHDHGTFCSGIVGHRHNGVIGQYRGIAPNVDLYVCKVLDAKGSGSYANIAAAIDWARTNGMDIISMSLGGSASAAVLQQACDAAWYAGLLLVAAAGNSGPGDNTVGYPGKYASVMAVCAADYYENISDYSSRGPESEITGPGTHITGPWAGFTYKDYTVDGSNNLYINASGTSAACPHVAACAALVKQWYPAQTNLDLRNWLINNARDL